MIYLLLAITIPILGAKGLDTFLEVYEENKSMKKVYTVIGGLFIMSLLSLCLENLFYHLADLVMLAMIQ